MASRLVEVPDPVARTAAAALRTRLERGGGGTRAGVMIATALTTGYVTDSELDELRAWHDANPDAVIGHASTLLGGLYGGAPARTWEPRTAGQFIQGTDGKMNGSEPGAPAQDIAPSGPSDAALQGALEHWTGTGNPSATDTQAITAAIEAASPTTDDLYRGMSVDGTAAEVAARYPEGATVSIGLGSFSRDPEIADAHGLTFGQGTQVMLHVEPGAQGLPIPYDRLPEAYRASFQGEQEVIVHGDFTIIGRSSVTLPERSPGQGERQATMLTLTPLARTAAVTDARPIVIDLPSFAELRDKVHTAGQFIQGPDGKMQGSEPGGNEGGSSGFSSAQQLADHWESRGLKVDIAEKPESLVLSRVVVPAGERGQGTGSAFMRDLTKYADDHGKAIGLTPSKAYGATSVGRLTDFYKGFGFVRNTDRNADYSINEAMVRQPRTAALASAGLPLKAKLAKMSRTVNATDRRTMLRLHSAATVALEEAMRQAGVKLATRARNRSRSQLATIASAQGRITNPVLAAYGVTEQELFDKRFDTLGTYATGILTAAEIRKLRAAAQAVGFDPDEVEKEYTDQIDQRAAAAVAVLIAGLGALAHEALAGNPLTPETARGEYAGPVPFGVIRDAFNVASTGEPASSELDQLATGLREVGTTLVEDLLDTAQVATVITMTWSHGDPDRPFPAHEDLDGISWESGGEYPAELYVSEEDGWLGVDMYQPGDHLGCSCEIVSDWAPAEEGSGAAAGDLATSEGTPE